MKGNDLVQNTSFKFLGVKWTTVEKQTLVQKTHDEKDISPKCNPTKGQAKVHSYKVVQNTIVKCRIQHFLLVQNIWLT